MIDVEIWNEKYPSRTKVRYFPIKEDLHEYIDSETCGVAYHDSSGEPVIHLKGKSGYVSLEHITPLDKPQEKEKEEPVVSATSGCFSRSLYTPPGNAMKARARAACGGNKWAIENCKAVGNWD